MSGVSISSNYNDEQRRVDAVNNTGAIVNAGATIAVGAVAVSAVAVGLAVVGTVKAIKALGKFGMNSYRKHKQREAERQLAMHEFYKRGQAVLKNKRERTESINTSRRNLTSYTSYFTADSEDVSSEVREGLKRLDEIESQYIKHIDTSADNVIKELEAIKAEVEKAHKLSEERLLIQLDRRRNEIMSAWEAMNHDIKSNYADKQSAQLKVAVESLNAKYKCLSDKVDALGKDDEMKIAQIKRLSEIAIADAENVICTLASKRGAISYTEDIKALSDSLLSAKRVFAEGHYNTAFSQALNVNLNGFELITEVSDKEMERKAALDSLTLKLAQIGEEISVDKVRFNHKGKIYEDSIRRYAEHGFNSASRILDCLWARVDDDISLDEIRDLSHNADRFRQDFQSIYNLGMNRMLAAYNTRDAAIAIKRAFATQGLKMEESAYEGNIEGEALHINFSSVKGDKFTVVLSFNSNSEKPNVMLHHYPSNNRHSLPDRALERSLNSIIDSTLGVEMKCTEAGKFSKTLSVHNLKDVKSKKVN